MALWSHAVALAARKHGRTQLQHAAVQADNRQQAAVPPAGLDALTRRP